MSLIDEFKKSLEKMGVTLDPGPVTLNDIAKAMAEYSKTCGKDAETQIGEMFALAHQFKPAPKPKPVKPTTRKWKRRFVLEMTVTKEGYYPKIIHHTGYVCVNLLHGVWWGGVNHTPWSTLREAKQALKGYFDAYVYKKDGKYPFRESKDFDYRHYAILQISPRVLYEVKYTKKGGWRLEPYAR